MSAIAIVAAGAVSALGTGTEAYQLGAPGAKAPVRIAQDAELVAAGLRRPFAARVHTLLPGSECEDRARVLLHVAARELVRELDAVFPRWRALKVGVVIGTSGGGMPSLQYAFQERALGHALRPELARSAPYFGPLAGLEQVLEHEPARLCQVLAACASSTIAIGLGCRWLQQAELDLVLAGGYDALSVFIAAGFEALGATSATYPAPFRKQRDGMALGEGAALVALGRPGELPSSRLGFVHGFAATSDAVHITAPDRQGNGLCRAAQLALADAELHPSRVNMVSAHGTATAFNDAAEGKAISGALGEHAAEVVVHAHKANIGHTLGAAGVLEMLAVADALERGILPASAGSGDVDPNLAGVLLEQNAVGRPEFCLKLSAAFGGANAALVIGRVSGPARVPTRHGIAILATGEPRSNLDVERVRALSYVDDAKLARLDAVSELAVAAAASALAALVQPLPERSGVVVGTIAATLEVNELFDRRRRERGARFVEPRRFPPTSPNLAGGQCSIIFGLRGPSLTVGSGLAAPTEALLVAGDLLEAGDLEAVVVIAVDHVDAVVRDIWRSAGWPVPVHGATAVVLGRSGSLVLDRAKLAAAHEVALGGQGRLDGAEPGWPAFLAALGRAAPAFAAKKA